MQKRPLGATGIDVSEVGLGAWQLGNTTDWHGPDEAESHQIVKEALSLGINFFDTAPNYAGGRSEQLLGRALVGAPRDQIVLCTKYGHRPGGRTDFSASEIEDSVDHSLRTLGVDYLDVLLLHNPPAELHDGSAPHYAELDRLVEAGKLRAYGVSLDWAADLDRVIDTTASKACEVFFNAFHQEPLPAMERARDRGVGLIIKVPLDSGWLSGRYRRGATFDDIRSRWTPEQLERRYTLLERFEAALPDGVSTSHGAMRFVLAQPSVSTVIPGSRTVEQLRDSVASADQPLPAETVAAIRALWEEELAAAPLGW
ncbi:MAG TPA: aldo/keto reductase [Egibacteraceae bacterium]|nr:aldo/keto reductase [Egibacteraceae bacterium]